jgi:hypothetical protein
MEFLSIAFSMRFSIWFNSEGLRKSDSIFVLLQLRIKKTVKNSIAKGSLILNNLWLIIPLSYKE